MTGKKPVELEDLIELPNQLKEHWFWFLNLNSTRPSGFGFSAISYTEIKSYFDLMQIKVDVDDVEVIKMFDRAAQEFNNIQQEKEQQKNKNKKK